MNKRMEFGNLKEYAKRYGISVLHKGKHKSVHKLSNDIYKYEVNRNVKNGLYPFLTGKSF
jgi:transposase-like protein